jgi:hypothetical protein
LSSNGDGNGELAWTPADPMPGWAAKLLEDFPPEEVGLRPQVWCKDCREHQYKACGKTTEIGGEKLEHRAVKCKDCGQKVTRAHSHLDYVGHANVTKRLLDADPRWSWRPMARDVPEQVMLAAIATGDQAIIAQVIASYPPKLIELEVGNGRKERVLWGELVIHDEDGNEVVTPGVGDAKGKLWGPDALKEMIGDFLRNSGQRRGLAWKLWAKQLADQNKRDRGMGGADDPGGYAARAAIFDQDQAGEGTQAPQGQGRRRARPAPAPKQEEAAGGPPIDPEAQASADLAIALGQKPGITIEALAAEYDKALTKKLTTKLCVVDGETVKVFQVWGRVKRQVEGLPVPGGKA